MKKFILFLGPLIFLFSCERNYSDPKLNLTGLYEGTYSGYSQPYQINGQTELEVTQVGDSITAIISSPISLTYKAQVVGDTVLHGRFVESYQGVSVVNGQIIDGGNELIIETSSSDAAYNYFRVKIDVFRKP